MLSIEKSVYFGMVKVTLFNVVDYFPITCPQVLCSLLNGSLYHTWVTLQF